MKNLYLLSTDKPSILGRFIDTNNLFLRVSNDIPRGENVNIYITSDEEIKDGEWHLHYYEDNPVISKSHNRAVKVVNEIAKQFDYKKIILTTDQDLIEDGIQEIDDEFLEWFVKNPTCEYVEIENIYDKFLNGDKRSVSDFRNKYKIIIPKEEPKQEINMDEIEKQVKLTEARGEKIIKYLEMFKGQSIYNDIALAIEFGYQLRLEEDE